MPTKNPRLSVVLSPSLAATLDALSSATGDSASSLVRNILVQTEPALQRATQLIEAAAASRQQVGAGVAATMDRVITDLEDALLVADARAGQAIRDLVGEAEAVKGRRRAAATGGARRSGSALPSTPVPVTRGSGTGKTRRKGVQRG